MLGLEGYGSGSESESENKSVLPSKPKPKKKIIISAPKRPTVDTADLEDERPSKKLRLSSGAGASSLLSMLPAPKRQDPVLPKTQRVLGGGSGPGLIFNTVKLDDSSESATVPELSSSTTDKPSPPKTDFFSLESTSKVGARTSTSSILPAVSSAPAIPTYEPPEPTQDDPYPGYHQLPSGKWEMYDPEYYGKFAKKWKDEYDAHVRTLEKRSAKGFEDLDRSHVEEVDAQREMERAKQEIKLREERKAITLGAAGPPAMPNMKITASKMSNIARTRHQLGTMLMEAYQNREALEEKIAEGRRNRKEAGNKYGF